MIEVFKSIDKLDFLVNCAGLSNEEKFINLTMNQIKEVFDVQLYGKMIACRCAYPLLLKSSCPRIINIAKFL